MVSTKIKVPYVAQMIQTECGLCCCAMILQYYKRNETLLDLREYLEVGRDGLSMRQLQELLKDRKMDSKMYKVNLSQLKGVQLPVIAHWNNEHFIIIEKIKGNNITIVDPANGRKKVCESEFVLKFSNYILTAYPTNEFTQCKRTRKNPWRYVLNILLEKKWLMLIALIISIISYSIMLKIPQIVQEIIDNTTISQNALWLDKYLSIIGVIALIYLSIVITRGVAFLFLNISTSKGLVGNTFKHLLDLPFKFFDVRTSGDLMYRLGSLNGLRELLTSQLIGGIVDLGALVFILYYMINKSPELTVISVIIFFANIIFMITTRNPIAESINEEITQQSISQSLQVEALYSISTIKMGAIEEQIFDTWNKSFDKVLDKYKKRSIIQNLYNSINSTFQTIGPIIVLVVGIFFYFEKQLTIGEVIAFQTLSANFFGLSTSLFGVYTQYILATSYLERVSDIWEQVPEERPKNPINHELMGKVELKNISFAYTSHSEKVIKDVNLSIEKGQKVAIVGASGSGKSTLSKIIVGLYSPTNGQVVYDDISLKDLDRKEICKQMGIVPQDIMLFNKTILDNITNGNEEYDIKEVEKVCRIAQIHNEIASMPMGYKTVISEMGLNLSGGQRQRIALAKALLSSPKIIILDEATSSLDVINESKISNYLKQEGCTRIVIAHRLSTIIDSDMIFVMNDGEIIENGIHEELINMHGFYYNLYNAVDNILV
ncbi:peptidase domain-containing ABC transporter [Clostridium gasigenes]|uniref:peptidase domain-containing ABC transporter n=1 Tax=Clostridium gasigenes TaxID=94869 RepID=UPI001C0D2128|nr:peptidase domain-containing ABC transporter [Clostridium gasigenes]MBU3107030.1 peptidase domain-containing ABC transporter [Clostridium gasigenes]